MSSIWIAALIGGVPAYFIGYFQATIHTIRWFRRHGVTVSHDTKQITIRVEKQP